MKTRNALLQYFTLFGAVFMLAAALTVSIAPKASAACVFTLCGVYYSSCPPESDCPGEECYKMYDHAIMGQPGNCCGDMTHWDCIL